MRSVAVPAAAAAVVAVMVLVVVVHRSFFIFCPKDLILHVQYTYTCRIYIILNKTLPFGCSPSSHPYQSGHPERFIIQVFGITCAAIRWNTSLELKTGKMPCIPSEVGMLSCCLFLCMGVSKNKGTPKMDGL